MWCWEEVVSYLPLAIWYLQGFLTPVIGFLAVYIAWQQWHTSAQKTRLDLFDRRFRVFVAVREVLALMFTVVSDDKKLFELMSQIREAQFLFGPEIKDYAENVSLRATRLSDASKQLNEMLWSGELARPDERKRLADIRKEEFNWATAEARVVADRFKDYLDMSKL